MNLIAKEYIASKNETDGGVLILSEMAGAAKELGEAIIINPNSVEEISEAIEKALEIPKITQIKKIAIMQDYLKRSDVFYWAKKFLAAIQAVKDDQEKLKIKSFTSDIKKKLLNSFKTSQRRLLFLDYDGTLIPFQKDPSHAKPTDEIKDLLKSIGSDKKNEVVLVSGRDKLTLERWFGELPINLVGEHGLQLKEKDSAWKLQSVASNYWKKDAIELLTFYSQQLPGSTIEEKDYSVAWHYRKSNPLQALIKAKELLDDLVSFTANNKDLQILHGNKVIEIKPMNINKGSAGARWIEKGFDFVMAIGDDKTDEDLFNILSKSAFSIKVGMGQSNANYNIANTNEVLELLRSLVP